MKRDVTRRWALGLALWTAGAAAQAAVQVLDATQVSYNDYRIVKRLWVDSWRTAIGIQHSGTREAAVQEVVSAAESAGADAVVNLYCVGGEQSSARGYYCYADAVKLVAKPDASRKE